MTGKKKKESKMETIYLDFKYYFTTSDPVGKSFYRDKYIILRIFKKKKKTLIRYGMHSNFLY